MKETFVRIVEKNDLRIIYYRVDGSSDQLEVLMPQERFDEWSLEMFVAEFQ